MSSDHDWLYAIVGKITVGAILFVLAAIGALILWALAGYIVGAFRYRRLGIFIMRPPWYMTVAIGASWFWDALWSGGGWYQNHEGKKVYRFGFGKPDEDDE